MIAVTAGSAFFDGVCGECHPPEPEPETPIVQGERGRVVTSVNVAGQHFTLCFEHTNKLIEQLSRAGVRRDL